jgi:hypothetical protein
MSYRYHVKFTTPTGETIYGIAAYLDEKEKKEAPAGHALIQDAVLPRSYWVPETQLVDIETEYGTYDLKTGEWKNQDELHTFVSAEFRKAQELSDSLGDGVKVGKLFSIGVADGSAWYVVTRVKGSKCDVEWRGFFPDRWTDHHFGWGRKNLSVKDVARYIKGRRLFSTMASR